MQRSPSYLMHSNEIASTHNFYSLWSIKRQIQSRTSQTMPAPALPAVPGSSIIEVTGTSVSLHSTPAQVLADTQLMLRPDVCWEQHHWVRERATHRQDMRGIDYHATAITSHSHHLHRCILIVWELLQNLLWKRHRANFQAGRLKQITLPEKPALKQMLSSRKGWGGICSVRVVCVSALSCRVEKAGPSFHPLTSRKAAVFSGDYRTLQVVSLKRKIQAAKDLKSF